MIEQLHIGIIPDGNRRFAKDRGVSFIKSYEKSFENIKEILLTIIAHPKKYQKEIKEKYKILYDVNVKYLTLFVCSKDNIMKRSDDEKKIIYQLIEKFADYCLSIINTIKKNKLKINIAGDTNLLDGQLKDKLDHLIKITEYHENYELNLAIGYDGREEIINAIQKYYLIEHENNNGDISINTENLYKTKSMQVNRDIDIVIRTGYEKRMSGFFPWQTVYAEWFFIDKYFPEFTLDDFINVIKEYYNRKRRFGK